MFTTSGPQSGLLLSLFLLVPHPARQKRNQPIGEALIHNTEYTHLIYTLKPPPGLVCHFAVFQWTRNRAHPNSVSKQNGAPTIEFL